MLFNITDRTAELDQGIKALQIRSTDFCRYYCKHPYTVLWKQECWTCRFGDFGVDAGNPTDTGLCKHQAK